MKREFQAARMVRLLLRHTLMCLRTATDRLVRPKGWKGKGDLLRDNIKMDLQEMEGTDWIYLAKDRNRCRAVVKTVMNLRFP